MGDVVGVDLGTTSSAAAVARAGEPRARIVELGARSTVVPSVVHATRDEVVFGEAAEDRALSAPNGVAREFKRMIGSEAPIILGGGAWTAELLSARLLQHVLARVTAIEGRAPSNVVLTHPASWGDHRLATYRAALAPATSSELVLLPEPVAAALHHATLEQLAPGATVAVYDLGGGTFDAAVVRLTETGAEVLGAPQGIEQLGGSYFDDFVFEHLQRANPELFDEPDDTLATSLLGSVRDAARRAREALSSDSSTVVTVATAGGSARIRLTRQELEIALARPLAATLDVLQRTIESAGVEAGGLDRIVLAGGAARTPMVAQLVASRFGRPVSLDPNPKHSVALGAAVHGSRSAPASFSPEQTASAATIARVVRLRPTVDAVLCQQRHPMPPMATVCQRCGSGVGDPAVRSVLRPSLGSLRFDSGLVVELDRPQVLGRRPARSSSEGEEPALVALPDPDQVLSRNHVDVRLEGWDVVLVDRGSTNGTFVDGRRLDAGNPCTIRPGAQVTLADAVRCRYEVAQ